MEELIKKLIKLNKELIKYNDLEIHKEIISVLYELGKCYLIKADELSHNLVMYGDCLLHSSLFFNAALSISTNTASNFLNAAIKESIEKIEELFLKRVFNTQRSSNTDIFWSKITLHRKQWKEVETVAKLGLKQLDEQWNKKAIDFQRAIEIDEIYTNISHGIKALIVSLIEETINETGIVLPTKDFAFICFGSLARNAATPYSDLEFAILLQDIKYREDFRKLTYFLAFKIINLRQTVIPKNLLQDFETDDFVDLDNILTSGLQFDLGGKTPIGRRDNNKYDLIQTPDGLANYFVQEGIDKLLPIEITVFDHLYGNLTLTDLYKQALLSRYQQSNDESLNQLRAKNFLLQGSHLLPSDLSRYSPQLGEIDQAGALYQVKFEIYRLADRVIEDLALYFGIIQQSTFSKIDLIIEKLDIHNKQANENLKILESIGREIRLRTYLNNQGQRERLATMPAIFTTSNNTTLLFCEQIFHMPDTEVLIYYYCVAFRLVDFIKKFFENKKHIIYQENFFDNSEKILTLANLRLLKYQDSQLHCNKWCAQMPTNAEAIYFKLVIDLLQGNNIDTINIARLDQLLKAVSLDKNPIAYIAINIVKAAFFFKTQKYSDSSQILVALLKIPNLELRDKALIYLNLATINLTQGDYLDSEINCKQALIWLNKDQQKNLTLMGNIYQCLMTSYYHQAKYQDAEKYYQEGQKQYIQLYGRQPNPNFIRISLKDRKSVV